MRTPILALSTLLALGTGCAFDGSEECEGDGEKCDQPGGNGSLITTFNGNAQLYTGYHTLFDKTSSQCVAVDKEVSSGAQISVGAVNETLDLTAVTSREELATELGLDLGLKVKYLTTDADATVNLVRKTKTTNTTINLLLKVSQSYVVRNRHQLKLTDAGLAKLKEGPDKFVQTCGTNYVNGARYAGTLFVLITYEARDAQTALDVKSSLGVGTNVGAAKVDAEVKMRLSQAASMAGVSATVRVAAGGFDLGPNQASSSLVSDFIGSGVNAETFKKIDEIRTNMERSLQKDACRDAGEGQCDGAAAPGYLNNTRRSALPTGVDVGFYDALPNVSFSGTNPFKIIKERTLIIERFVRDWAELEERMEVIYRNEIEPFLKASASDKASYQIAPPGKSFRTPTEILAAVQPWSDEFFPEIGTQIGFTFELVSNKVRDCWQQASVDFNTQCTPDDVPGVETQEWKDTLAKIDRYAGEARVLQLQYKAHEGAIANRQKQDACADLNSSGISYRPPTLAEVSLLAPLVAFGTITWPSGVAHEVWFNHPNPTQMCSNPDFPNPFFRNTPSSDKIEFACGEKDGTLFDGKEIAIICVPSGGPLPLSEAP